MKEYLYGCITESEFEKAEEFCRQLNVAELSGILDELAWEKEDVSVYLFLEYLLLKNECADYHRIAADLLQGVLCFLGGAYWVAYRHTRRALELEPENDRNKESLLSFYDIPDKILSMEEALKVAEEVLREKPDSIFALQKYKKIQEDYLSMWNRKYKINKKTRRAIRRELDKNGFNIKKLEQIIIENMGESDL